MATNAPPPIERIRNFAIVAHIDHGKSTLADRILELTGTVDQRDMRAQFLDRMDIERERGITIKAQAVRVDWEVDGVTYALNMVDTPGHVDFAYEVSRALAACEGVVLLVDSTQGIEAQTVSHAEHAKDLSLAIIPAVNKIDVAGADPVEAALELAAWLDSDPEAVIPVSAKTGAGVAALLDAVVAHIPPPTTGGDEPRALIFDSEYDNYRGVVAYVRVVDGFLEKGARLQMVGSRAKLEALEVGRFGAKWEPCPALGPGEVGYVVTNLKALDQCRVGDTVAKLRSEVEPLPGYRPARQMVFASLFPVDAADFNKLREGLERLALNDSSVTWEVENNPSFGFGLRAGFLGPLHKEVIQERLEREHGVDLITTAPTVAFRLKPKGGEWQWVERVGEVPENQAIEAWEEPVVEATISCPRERLGKVMEFVQSRRGIFLTMENPGQRVLAKFEIPLAEIVANFFAALKSLSQGYAGLDYDFSGWRAADLGVLEILVAGEPVEALGAILPKAKIQATARALVDRLAKEIPRHQFRVPVQARSGGRIIAARVVPPFRKDVIAKCYGGDITRKRKLLEKQKAGKKRLKQVGKVAIPQSALLSILDI